MALLGESFDPYVKDQIDIRQEKLSLRDKDDDILKYITNKTSFLRLTSGINIDDEVANDLGINIGGNIPASNFILFSSTFDKKLTSDIGYGVKSYGYASSPDYGLVPPPGLISAEIRSLNKGSIREATIKVICHNLVQFKIISTLFLKLRYSLLLEWGHTIYFNNNRALESPLNIPDLSTDFLNGIFKWKENNNDNFINGNDQESLLKSIEFYRKQSNGNYDAFFGVVKNFNWQLLENGSYDITINAISTGDVIESIKSNVNNSPDEVGKPIVNDTDVSFYQKSTLHRILGSIKNELYNNYSVDILNNLTVDKIKKISGINYTYKNPNESNNEFETFKVSIFKNLKENTDNQTTAIHYYIKLGTLLKIIESFILYGDTSKKDNPPPVFNIDYNFNTNECFTIPGQISIDPRVCLIPLSNNNIDIINQTSDFVQIDTTYEYVVSDNQWIRQKKLEEITYLNEGTITPNSEDNVISVLKIQGDGSTSQVPTNTVGPYPDFKPTDSPVANKSITYQIKVRRIELNTDPAAASIGFTLNPELQYAGWEFRSDSSYIGKVMNIHIDISYIISILDNFVDPKDGSLALYDFLQELLIGMQRSLGNINSFEIIQNPDNNTYSIIDNSLIPIKYNNLKKENISKFNINLLKEAKDGGGSFVTNFGLKSELFSKIANTIAIGAQANANVLGSNSTSFSEFNKGLTDRILVKKDFTPNSEQDPQSKYTVAANKYIEYLKKYAEGTNSKLTTDDISFFESYIVDIYNYIIGTYTQDKKIPGTGFIPLNLQLTMDGLSGIKLYQTFEIDETLLPKEYQNRIRFIIRGLNHKIDTQGWETSIETLSIPKENNINNNINIKSANVSTSTTDIKKAKELTTNGGCDPLNSNRLSVAESILKEANIRGIKDKNRLTCLLTVAYAETRFDLETSENFKYKADKIGTGTKDNQNGDASFIFKDSLKKAGIRVPDGLRQILNNPSDSLANYVYANRGQNGGPSSGDGFKYRGRGISQTTFKGGYQTTQDALKRYNINIDLINNPDNIFQYEIQVLVIGKLEGLYGKKLSSSVDYINNATNIAQTQNGGDKSASDNYIRALNCINNNTKIQELISRYS